MARSTAVFDYLIRLIQGVLDDVVTKKSKPTYHFFLDMVFGIMKSSSLVLNDIAHALNEDIPLKKTNTRLYKNLLKNHDISLRHNLISAGNAMSNHLFIVDDSDIVKPYGKKFERLMLVKDASSLDGKYEKGYMMTSIVAITKTYYHPVVLFTEVHSSTAKNFKSVNNITNRALSMVCNHLGSWTGTFVFDRGYDDIKLMNFLNDHKQYFIIRIKNNRTMKVKNRRETIFSLARRRKGKVNVEIKIKGVKTIIKASHFVGKINGFKEKVTITTCYLFNNPDPLVLITNQKINNKDDLKSMVYNYLARWRIEEHFRIKKEQFGLENFRVKSLTSINNLCLLLDIVFLILAKIVETQMQNMIFNEVLAVSKKIRENAFLKYYQVISGVKTIFARNKKGVKNYKRIERWEYEEFNLFNSIELTTKKRVRKVLSQTSKKRVKKPK